MWGDIITGTARDNNLPKDVILQSWNGGLDNIKTLTLNSCHIIVSSSNFFYLNGEFTSYVTKDPHYDVMSNLGASTGNLNFTHSGGGDSWCAPYKI